MMWFYRLLDWLEISLGFTVSLCGYCGQDAAIAYLPKPICRACSHKGTTTKALYGAKDNETTVALGAPLSGCRGISIDGRTWEITHPPCPNCPSN